MPSGLPNESTRCYLNVVMQAARVCIPDFDYTQDHLYTQLKLDDGPQDAHETWLRLVDYLEKTFPKDMFYGTQEETCISKSNTETRTVTFGCMLSDKPEEYITTSDSTFVLKKTRILTVPKIMVYVFDNAHPIKFLATNSYGKKLIALIVHVGNHYVAIVRENDEWFLINDMIVQKIVDFDYNIRAYMAFYV